MKELATFFLLTCHIPRKVVAIWRTYAVANFFLCCSFYIVYEHPRLQRYMESERQRVLHWRGAERILHSNHWELHSKFPARRGEWPRYLMSIRASCTLFGHLGLTSRCEYSRQREAFSCRSWCSSTTQPDDACTLV